MRKPAAALASAAFFIAAPGTVAGLIPWLITHWETTETGVGWRVLQAIGVVAIVAGMIPPVHAFIEFVRAGGTPMPVAPTQRLVVSGFNRYLRNPMYAGLLLAILGQALLFSSLGLVLYAVITWAVTASFVRWYEEPTLMRTYGTQYAQYRRNVPAWWPRLRAWTVQQSG
jgi:protein-S-isoprenylcysteine O-methyltransferase Ste14